MSAVRPVRREGPLFEPEDYLDAKDPCIVHDGSRWHIFGSRGSIVDERWRLLHATAPSPDGPWTDGDALELAGMAGDRIAAPGVVFADGKFHMFVHSDFLTAASSVEHLVSEDGRRFVHRDTVVRAEPLSDEAGIYDPHPAEIGGRKYVVYSATGGIVSGQGGPFRPQPDLYLVESLSGSWDGPWERRGRVLDQETLPHHNRKDDPHYEWGVEGPQLLELPGGLVLLNATCFLPGPRMGIRQRVFFAAARSAEGPFATLGPVLDTADAAPWEAGENGHASAILTGDELHLFYQGRHASDERDHRNNRWRHGHAVFALEDVMRAARRALGS